MSLYKPYEVELYTIDIEQPTSLKNPKLINIKFDINAGGETQAINTSGIFSPDIPVPKTIYRQIINPAGLYATNFPSPKIINKTQEVKIIGFLSSSFGLNNIWNFNKEIKLLGFNTQVFGTTLKVYNLRQYLNLNDRGFNAALYGVAYFQGGVKYVAPIGFNTSIFPDPKAINTRADQYLNLSNIGIAPLAIPNPNVSPRFIRPSGILDGRYGSPIIYLKTRYLSAQGVNTQGFGIQWISHNPRYLTPTPIDTFLSGYPKVLDPTQRVGVTGVNTVISGGVFGDVSIRNTRRFLKAIGFDAHLSGDWSNVESNLRKITHKGFDSLGFGSNSIRNKTPSIAPIGIYAFAGLDSSVGYRIRTVKPSGFYQPKFGKPALTKTPELKPSGINQNLFGSAWVSYRTRSVYAGLGRESMLFGGVTAWHYSRKFNPAGIKNDAYGLPRIEHSRRLLLTQGSNQALYGNNTWVSFAKRQVQPNSIVYPNIPIHRVGGTQHINPLGYIATLFGTRIVPESQSIYPQGFINPFGLTVVDLWKKYIKPSGFLTTGQEGGHRFGAHKFWNLRQYIVQFYDGDSGLVPPLWSGWTSVENKNKSIGAIGSNLARMGVHNIENNARLIAFNGLNALTFGQAMIADRVRYLKLQGMESPYISGWSVIYNAAPVIAQRGFKADTFGLGSVVNTRRYFNRIGNFESLAMGTPMVADRIRTLKFEQRYTIAPPYIPIHRIDLHTRYIEEVGRFDDHQLFGNPSLSIHWNVITPRWTLRDAYGSPTIKNVTPELGTRGRNSEEFGESGIRTQWRELIHLGSETVVWGRSEIAFRDRQFSVSGFTQWAIPRHSVTKTGVPPYYPQYIWLDAVKIDGKQNDGHGISLPKDQVSVPNVKTNVIFPKGFIASLYGSHYTQSNGILVQPGLQELTIGNHFVGLKNRTITVPTMGDSLLVSKPRLSPWTIYAVMESPSQAQANHEPRDLHFVNSDSGTRLPGEVFGHVRIELKHRKLNVGMGNQSQLNSGHKIALRKRYINLTDFGFRSQRTGFHVVGPFDQHIVQFDAADGQGFGQTLLKIPHTGPYFIKPNGLPSMMMGRPVIDFFNRTVKASGRDHLQMGTRLNGDKPFMWQGLRIGELVPGNYGGFESEVFGKTFISLKVRDLILEGFETFAMEYDYTNFKDRMRVTRKEIPRPKIQINVIGFDATTYGVPNIKPTTQYIRPDGNSDQFRKGAW